MGILAGTHIRRCRLPVAAAAIVLSCACSRTPGLITQYEYDETVDLSLDGSAIVYVSGSIPSLIALHGVDLDPDPLARFDRAKIRQLYTAPGVAVRQITASRRNSRRFVHVTLDVDDVRTLNAARSLSWSQYQFDWANHAYVFVESITGSPARKVPGAEWTGRERVAFRLHVPSRVLFHNAPAGNLRRGNIVLWEQPLADRLAATPARLEVRMETQSILFRTLLIFVSTFVAAVTTLAVIVWTVMRQGQKVVPAAGGSQRA
jgi:hypothetical protein